MTKEVTLEEEKETSKKDRNECSLRKLCLFVNVEPQCGHRMSESLGTSLLLRFEDARAMAPVVTWGRATGRLSFLLPDGEEVDEREAAREAEEDPLLDAVRDIECIADDVGGMADIGLRGEEDELGAVSRYAGCGRE